MNAKRSLWGLVILGVVSMRGFAMTGPSDLYKKVYDATDPKKAGFLKPGSDEEKRAVKNFTDFLSDLSTGSVKNGTAKVYAEDAYFNDTLKEITGAPAIEAYLYRTAESVDACTVDFLDVSSHEGEYYFRWLMKVKFKKFKRGEVQPSIGVTHIRFNREGKVAFHQDYWDAAGNLFEQIPVLGWVIRKIKKGL